MKISIIILSIAVPIRATRLARRIDDDNVYLMDLHALDSLNVKSAVVNAKDTDQNYQCFACKSLSQRTQESLLLLMLDMKSFVQDKSFDTKRYELQRSFLEDELARIATVVETSSSTELRKQFDFVSQVFSVLEDYVPSLKHYRKDKQKYHRWMYKILIVNVQLWLMHDSYGKLDHSLEHSRRRLQGYQESLNLWKEIISLSPEVPSITRLLFEERIQEAESTIRNLWSQLSDEKPRQYPTQS